MILIPIIISIGLALLARALYRPKDQAFLIDNKPNTASIRGSYLPLVIGRRRVGAIILWVGDRQIIVEEEQASGGKGFGGGASVKTNIYYEKALHGLCVGPAAKIYGIFADGKLIPGTENLDSRLYPSGTAIPLEHYGNLRIYWGELEQPISPLAAGALGIATALPYCCRAEWDSYRISGPRWPILEYEVECPACDYQPGPITNPLVTADSDVGINPAQIMWQLLTASYPHGAALPISLIDCAGLTVLGDIAYTELIGMNILVQNGDDAETQVGQIMQDFTFMMPEINGVIGFVAVRNETASVPTLTGDLLLPPKEEIQTTHTKGFGNQLIYVFDDRDQNYKEATIDVDDDTAEGLRNARAVRKVNIPTVTVHDVASRIAARRQVEDLDPPLKVSVKGSRALRTAQPGQLFDMPNVGKIRLVSLKVSFDDPAVEMEYLRDPYQQNTIIFYDPPLPGAGVVGALKADIRFRGIELPYLLSPNAPRLAVLRIRDNASIFAAQVIASSDLITYTNIGSQDNPATGGLVAADWNPNNDTIIEDGPQFLVDGNGDESIIPTNLSALPSSWQRGDQILVVDDEILFVREIVFVSGTTWAAKGVIRGRASSGKAPISAGGKDLATIALGQPLYVIRTGRLNLLFGPMIETSGVSSLKTLPINTLGQFPAGAVIPQSIVMTSEATRTPPLGWLECGGSTGAPSPASRRDRTYAFAEDIVFEWLPVALSGGAGTQGFGQASAQSVVGGDFIIEVQYDPTFGATTFADLITQKTYTVPAASALDSDGVFRWNYTAAMRGVDGTDLGQSDSGSFLWQFKLSHNNGTLSDSLTARPRFVANNKIPLG